MNTKCNTCGAPQPFTENSKCNYCGEILKGNETENKYLDDFVAIQYEYKNRRYKKVIDLADLYLKRDKHNVPGWSYKIISEFLIVEGDNEPDFKGLISSIEYLFELKIVSSESLIVLENQLKDGIERSIAENYSNKYHNTEIESLITFSKQKFSSSFVDWLNGISQSLENIHDLDTEMDPESFCRAARFFLHNNSASVYLLKENLNLALVHSCTLMNQLESTGIIGYKMNASDSREVLFKTSEELESYLDDLGLTSRTTTTDTKSPNKKNNNGCFVATATMGSYNHPVVLDLRDFRDNWLLKRNWGGSFTNWYYTHGPKAARFIEKSKLLKKISYILFIKPIHIFIKLFLKKSY